jgi:hypothetical protein
MQKRCIIAIIVANGSFARLACYIRQFPQTDLYRDQVIRSLPAFRAFWCLGVRALLGAWAQRDVFGDGVGCIRHFAGAR